MFRPPPVAALLTAAAASLVNAEPTTTLKEVTVTASSEADSERQAAVTQKTVLDRKEIETLGGLTVGEVIRKLPGIEAGAHSGDGAPTANARGMGRDSVQFLVDGERPSANARYALTTVGRLPSGELERVEILRGASAEHGGSAPVTVNLIMRKAKPTTSTTLRAAAGLRGDEPNGQFTASLGGGDKAFSWILPLTINHHGMPQEKTVSRQQASGATRTLWQEESENSPYALNEFIVSPRLTWRDSEGSLSLWPSVYHNRGERKGEFTPLGLRQPGCRQRTGCRRQPPRTRGKPADHRPGTCRGRTEDWIRQALRPDCSHGRPPRAGHRANPDRRLRQPGGQPRTHGSRRTRAVIGATP